MSKLTPLAKALLTLVILAATAVAAAWLLQQVREQEAARVGLLPGSAPSGAHC